MMTQPMMHTMRMDGQEKPWRPANFPTRLPIAPTPIEGAESSSWTRHAPGSGAKPIPHPAGARRAAHLPFGAGIGRLRNRRLP
jgi:hypothetical protein